MKFHDDYCSMIDHAPAISKVKLKMTDPLSEPTLESLKSEMINKKA